MTRKLSKDEVQFALQLLTQNATELLEFSQFYMVFRLMGEEEGVDREALNYNKQALVAKFNEILKKNVPPPEKRNKVFQEFKPEDFKPAIQRDPLLQAFQKSDYIYHVTRPNIEEKEHTIADLIFDYPQGADNRYTLVCTLPELAEDVRNWGIIDSNPVTEITVEKTGDGQTTPTVVKHGVYRIYCFQCGEFFLFEMNEGDKIDQIACDKCHTTIIERRGRRTRPQ
jgi:hypothetical protein